SHGCGIRAGRERAVHALPRSEPGVGSHYSRRVLHCSDHLSNRHPARACPCLLVRVAADADHPVFPKRPARRSDPFGARAPTSPGRDGTCLWHRRADLSRTRPARRGGAVVRPPMIKVSSVSKSFTIPGVRRDTVREHALDLFRRRPQERLSVLESVSFELGRGESLGLMGRNGWGKSTLLKIVSGIYPADAGRVEVHAAITPILELGVGWNPDLDAIDNIELLGTVMGMTLKELRSATREILEFAELEKFAHLELRHYSSGMAARLAYAVAFRAVREVLILDEIFAVGDAGFKERCQARYRELHRAGHSLLLVSHDPRTIAMFCDRALLREGGRIVAEGAGTDVAREYQRLFAGPLPPQT